MPVRIRLARHGQKNTPYYHIVAINASKFRDAQPLEKLGEYDPIPRIPGTSPWISSSTSSSGSGTHHLPPGGLTALKKEKRVEWNVERIRHWLDVGAEPTETVVKLLERGGILSGAHKWQLHPKKRGLEKDETKAISSDASEIGMEGGIEKTQASAISSA